MESYVYLVGPYLDGGLPCQSSPSGGVVLSTLRGTGMASVLTEGTTPCEVSGVCMSLSGLVYPIGLDPSSSLPRSRD